MLEVTTAEYFWFLAIPPFVNYYEFINEIESLPLFPIV